MGVGLNSSTLLMSFFILDVIGVLKPSVSLFYWLMTDESANEGNMFR